MLAFSRRLESSWSSTPSTSGNTPHLAYDFSVLGNTPITYPIEWSKIKDSRLCRPRQRAELPWLYGLRRDVERGGAVLRTAS